MVNRDSFLTEEGPQAFAEANGFRMLAIDRVATNPVIHIRVETFLPADGFKPSKAYATRLLWRDLDHDDFGLNRPKIMNVIDSNKLEHDVVRKPLRTFRHHALGAVTI